MKTTFKRALSIVIALCVLLASATCLIGISAFADEPVNVALIDDTNEADRNRVIASSYGGVNHGYNAFDGKESTADGEKWWSGNSTVPAYLIIDLGQVYDLSSEYVMVTTNGDREITYSMYIVSDIGNIEYNVTNKDAIATAIKAGNNFIPTQKHGGSRPYNVAATGRYVMLEATNCVAYGTDVRRDVSVAEIKLFGVPHVDNESSSSDSTSSDNTTSNTSSDTSSDDTSSEETSSEEVSSEEVSSEEVSSEDSSVDTSILDQDYTGQKLEITSIDKGLGTEWLKTAARNFNRQYGTTIEIVPDFDLNSRVANLIMSSSK